MVLLSTLLLGLDVRPAQASEDSKRDDVAGGAAHGRLEGDVSVAFGGGATFGARAPRATIDGRIRYIEVLGLFGTYEDALGGAAEPERVVATGLEVRPLFLGRFLRGMGTGSAFFDLALDSIGLELGAAFVEPRGRTLGARPQLQAGLGFELPLFAKAQGLWLGAHGGARFGERAFDASSVDTPIDRALFLGLTLSYHLYVDAHLVDAGDQRAF